MNKLVLEVRSDVYSADGRFETGSTRNRRNGVLWYSVMFSVSFYINENEDSKRLVFS